MTSFAASSIRLLRRLFTTDRREPLHSAGRAVVLDGASAIAAVEAQLSDAAALHASYPASAAVRAWLKQEAAGGLGVFDQNLSSLEAATSRSALSSAMGLTLAGCRTAAFASGADFAGAADQLARLVGLNLPLVLHLACRGVSRQGATVGGGHEAYHLAADSGLLACFAANTQEAVDLTLIARQVAEAALTPVLIAMDGAEGAVAAQEVLLPEADLLRDFVGDPSNQITSPTNSQRLVFGETRRRLPRRHDLDLPLLNSPAQGIESAGLGVAAQSVYNAADAMAQLQKAVDAFDSMTGRRYDPVVSHHAEDAELVLVVQGAAFEAVAAVVEHLRRSEGTKVGVLGVRFLRPLPAEELAKHCRTAHVVAVLERLPLPLGAVGPLLREVQSACASAAVTAKFVNVSYGVGGLPIRAADLAELVRRLPSCEEPRLHLGLEFLREKSQYPKRQAYLDALGSDANKLKQRAIRADGCLEVRPSGSQAMGLLRQAGQDESLAGEVAQLVHSVAGGHLRSRASVSLLRGGASCIDRLLWSPQPLRDVGDELLLDVLALVETPTRRDAAALAQVKEEGTLLLRRRDADEPIALPKPVLEVIRSRRLQLRTVTAVDESAQVEAVLAACLAGLGERAEAFRVEAKKLAARREEALAELTEGERQQRLAALCQAFDSYEPLVPDACEVQVEAQATPRSDLLTQFGRPDQTLDAVPRFFDQTAVLYRDGRTEELIADPYAAYAGLPPVTAVFRDGVMPGLLAEFDPGTCDGAGRLWTSCPDGSILPVVLSAKALLDVGLELATASGKSVDVLRPILNKLAKQINRIVSQAQSPPTTARDLMQAALESLAKDGSAPPSDQRQAIEALCEEVGELPLARTAPFFDDAEQETKGTGELLGLIVNPSACRSPELLVAAAQGRGLKLVPRSAEAVERAQRLCDLFGRLPDVSANTIERLRRHPQVGPLAAIALSRHCSQTLTTGDGAEPASGAKLALRQVLTLAEYHMQPRVQQFLEGLEQARADMAGAIRQLLSDALPTGDLNALAEGLETLARDEADLTGLLERVEAAAQNPIVDASRLRRLVDISRRLADLRWRVEQGPDGLGRARVGLALSDRTAAWAGVSPFNPFLVPVSADASGEAVALARGLAEGQFQQVLAGFRLLRWARLEIERPREAPHEAPKLARLEYADLTEEERLVCPPLVLVGDGRSLASAELSQLLEALSAELPLKAVLLSDITGEAGTSFGVDSLDPAPDCDRLDAGLLAMLGRRAYVGQSSLAHQSHLAACLTGALEFDGPALVQIHAPSPQRHGFAPEAMLTQAELAVRSRAWPLFRFDPAVGGVFGLCLALEGNPQERDLLTSDGGAPLTPIDWARTEGRFAEHFTALAEGDPQPTPILEYLEFAPQERTGHTPYLDVPDGETKKRLRVSERLARDADHRLRYWRTLQELAGVVTPFTDKVRREAETELGASQQSALADLEREYESKIVAAANAHEADAVARLKQQLMAMAGFPGAPRNGGGADA